MGTPRLPFENVVRGPHCALHSDGRKYVGERKYDKANGKGTYYWPSGDRYEGEFKNDKMHGQGRYSWVRISPRLAAGFSPPCNRASRFSMAPLLSSMPVHSPLLCGTL